MMTLTAGGTLVFKLFKMESRGGWQLPELSTGAG